MKAYDHKKIEGKWQTVWDKKKAYQAKDQTKKPKFYSLVEFPYPSGDGLHVGHPRPYIGMDVISRLKRMQGFNVLYPIGWDAFGLPTENYAIKTGKDPRVVTKKNTDTFRRQIKSLGVSFDWSREINTTDPKYYKWTQWIFLQFLKKGLAYKAKMNINWCPKDKTGLANEEVINGACERCGTPVEKREKEQWMLAITKYAERLDKDLNEVDYLPQIKTSQRNWIGKSEGAEIEFEIDNGQKIKVFTTRPDTIFGATFLAIAPEIAKKICNKDFGIKAETDKDNKEKLGIDTGLKAKNPANGEFIPVYAVNYVSAEYGTGAVMGVPAHDERDFEFAKKFNLPIKQVVMPHHFDNENPPIEGKKDTKREVVHVILRNPKNNTVLLQFLKGEKWGNKKPVNFIIGGIEDWGSELDAAINEIREETGYTKIKLVGKIPLESSALFYAAHKDVNRSVHAHPYVFDLLGDEKVEITEDEYFTKDSHEMKWVNYDEVENLLTFENNKEQWRFFLRGGYAYGGKGVLTNSGKFNGIESEEAKNEIVKFVGGKIVTKFKLRDWVFSRQRYWGEPIPVVNCPDCGLVPVPDKDLPVELPKVKNYQPTDSGESPLANISKWVNVKCPKCKGKAKRETDTMPNWAGSSWYYLRYTDPKNKKAFASNKNLKYWLGNDPHAGGVNWYNGGNEHTTLHLLYSRFWHKFLYDLKLVPTNEPYMKRTSHGLILAEGGEKMSKSKGNVVNPDDIVNRFGADSLRLYEMFMGPFDQAIAWSENAIIGPRRFLERVWNLQYKVNKNKKYSEFGIEKAIMKVTEDIEGMKFNTAVSAMMVLVNEIEKPESLSQIVYEKLLKILSPFAPHITEEIWSLLGHKTLLVLEKWPVADPEKMKESQVKIVVQINGKMRATLMVPVDLDEEAVKQKALTEDAISKYINGQPVKRIIYVKNRLVNIVV